MKVTAVAVALSLFFIAGCSKKNEESFVAKSDAINTGVASMKRTTLKELGYNSVDEMLKKGWSIVEEFKPLKRKVAVTELENISAQEQSIPMTLDHLRQIGYNPDDEAGRKRINELFIKDGIRPDGIALSPTEKIEGGVVPSEMSEETNRAFVKVGTPEVKVEEKGIEHPDEVYVTEAINQSDRTDKITVAYSYQKGYKTSWASQVTGSFKTGVKGKIIVPLVAEGEVSTEITVGGSTTNGTEDATTETISSTYAADVEPKSKVIITVLTKRKKSKVTYKVPMSITGRLSANYYTLVSDHYFWFYDANTLLKDPIAEEGIVEAVENVTTEVMASESIKL